MRRGLLRIVIVCVAILAALIGYRFLASPSTSDDVIVVRRGSIETTTDALGRVEPIRQVTLSTQSSGPVFRISIEEGDLVKEGDLLLELSAKESHDAIEQAQRSVRIREMQLVEALEAPTAPEIGLVRARLRHATAARRKAQKDYDDIADESDAEGSEEALNLQVAKLGYEVAEAEFDRTMEGAPALQIERLRADLAEAELALRQATERLEFTRIRAPFAGTIMRIMPQVGENVPGFGPAVILADLSQLVIRGEIDELDIASIREGQSVNIRLDAFPAHALEGRLARLLPGISETRGATTYEAIIEFDGESLPFRPGMGANLVIVTEIVEDTLLVPHRAIRQAGRFRVARVRTGRRLDDVIVTTGLSNETEIEISSGLQEGQTIVMGP